MSLLQITPKQYELLTLIYRFRFLDRIFLQTVLGHKDYKRINVWLKGLVEKEYLGRIFTKDTPDRVKPALYFLEKNGLRYIRENYEYAYSSDLQKRTREHEKSETFQNHCLELGKIYLAYVSFIETEGLALTFLTQADYDNDDPLLPLFPDAHMILRDDEENSTHYSIEIVNRNTPAFALKHRIREYIDYFYDNKWHENSDDPFPTCLFFCENTSRKQAVTSVVRRLIDEYDNPQMTFKVTTWDKVEKYGFTAAIFSKISPDWEEYIDEEIEEDGYL